MVRIKQHQTAPVAASDSLRGIIIAFADTKTASIPTNHSNWISKTWPELKEDITACDGAYSGKVESGKCTHLIASPEQYNKKTARVKSAIDAGDIRIVTYEWLAASLDSDRHVDESKYDLDPATTTVAGPSATTNGNATQNGKSTKRARDSDDVDSAPAQKKAKSIPVDQYYSTDTSCRVHQDEQDVAFDVTLNQTAAGKNANKFYRLQLLSHDNGDYFTWTRWGRVGDEGQSKILGEGDLKSAISEFRKKFKDKTAYQWEDRDQPAKPGKYTLIEINYGDSEDDDDLPGAGERRDSRVSTISSASSEVVESKLPEPVSRLMSLIFNNEFFDNALADLDYDITKMPLGKLSKRTVLKGYEVLKELALLLGAANATGDTIEGLSNQYFSLIPHAFGRNRPPFWLQTI